MAPPRFNSISRRLAWMNLLVSASALLLASIAFLVYDQLTYRQNLIQNLSAQAQIVGANSASALMFNDPRAAENTLSALRSFPNVLSAGISTPDGHIFARFSRTPAEIVVVLSPGQEEVASFRGNEVILVRAINFQGKVLGSVFIRAALAELSHRLWRYLPIAAIVLLISLIAALLVSWAYRRSVAGPIVALAETAKAVSEQKNYSLRAAAVSDGTEIGMLVGSFNEMLQQIQSRDQALRQAQGELEQRVEERTNQLLVANRELEAFSYSVSHDLRGPLEIINGYVHILTSRYGPQLDADGREYLQQVRQASRRMAELIDDLLNLSRVTTTAMHKQRVDLAALARSVMDELCRREPSRQVEFVMRDCPQAEGDNRLLRIVLDNLLGNAWKYTSGHPRARIEFGCEQRSGDVVYFVRDDGAGFDLHEADRLFKPFQRLHSAAEFPGTGVGLATVQRIIQRHGGDVWAEAKVEKGATFYFTIGSQLGKFSSQLDTETQADPV
jgi:signal transduction histidine kinase